MMSITEGFELVAETLMSHKRNLISLGNNLEAATKRIAALEEENRKLKSMITTMKTEYNLHRHGKSTDCIDSIYRM